MSKKETNVTPRDESSANEPELQSTIPSSHDQQQLSARAVRVVIEGRVQGVGFRYFTRRLARELGVRGWVRNLTDGRVEALAAAEPETLERFVQRLRAGPRGGRVERLDVKELGEAAGVGEFEIRA